MLDYADLRPDQAEAWQWLASRTEALVPAPIGWGKTIITLLAIQKIREVYGPWRTVVFSRKQIVEKTWAKEFEKWRPLQGLTYACAAGRCREAVLQRPDVLGVNFENIEWFYDLVDADPTLRPEILVIDESHHMKGFTAARVKRHCGFKKLGTQKLPGHVHQYRRRIALTGTPNPEGYADLWPQEACISMKRRLGLNITTFRREHCYAEWTGERERYTVHREGEERIEQALAPITYKASLGRYLVTPPPVFSTIHIPWDPLAESEYNTLATDFEVDLLHHLRTVDPAMDLTGTTLDDLIRLGLDHALAPNEGVLLGKLRQACSGFVYDKQGRARLLLDHDAKLDALEDLVDRSEGVPLLVFVEYKAEAEMIRQRFPRAQIGIPKDLSAWQARKVPMLVCNPASAGEGLDGLQHGSHIGVFYSTPWSRGLFEQACGRLERGGQTRQCSFIRFERPNSIDQYVREKQAGKKAKLSQFLRQVTQDRAA